MAPRKLNSAELKEIQKLLLDRSKILAFDLAALENESAGEGVERVGSQSPAPGHPAELASDDAGKVVMYGQIQIQSDELTEVRDALDRLEQGTFGPCEQCNEPIPLERLRAIPYARLCVACRTEEEEG